MSSFSLVLAVDLGFLLLATVLSVLAAYKAYTSLTILKEPAYRSVAILTAAFGGLDVPYGLNHAMSDLRVGAPSIIVSQILWVSFLAGAVVALSLIDRAIKICLDLDFFHRDILFWRRGGRLVAWSAMAVIVFSYFFLHYAQAMPISAPFILYAISVLGISTFRAHSEAIVDFVRWWGALVVTSIVATFVANLVGYSFLDIFVSFFLYRAAGSLSGSTYHLELDFVYRVPRDVVFAFAANPENMMKLTRAFRSAKYLGKDSEGRDIVEATAEVFGIRVNSILKRKPIPPDLLEEEAVTDMGLATSRFVFIEDNGVTHVRASVEFEPTSGLAKILGGIGVNRIRRQFEKDAGIGRAYLEANKPR